MLLQDLNLASQTVLEGLNGLLDHRGTVFLPELGREVVKHSEFRVFGSQSPVSWGEGRRGLPGSFLNRFLKIGWEGVGGEEGEEVLGEGGRRREVEIVGGWRRREGGRVGFGEMKRFVEAAGVVGRRRAFWMMFGERERTTKGRRKVREYMDEVMGEEGEEKREEGRREEEEGKNLAPFVMSDSPFPPLVFLNKYRDVMSSIEAALLLKYPVIFTGISGSGKSTLIKFLGYLNNRTVRTIGLNASTDVTDLLGAFEQLDHSLQSSQLSLLFTPSLLRLVESSLNEIESSTLPTPTSSQNPYEAQIPNETHPNPTHHPPFSSLEVLSLKQLLYDLTNKGLAGVDSTKLLTLLPLLSRIKPQPEFYLELTSCLKSLSSQKTSQTSPKFIWLESELLDSLRKGDYLCLDQLHLSNPAVLSRLSPLWRENQTSMMVHELDKEVDIHPEFRVFMLADSKVAIHGKLARNAIEINLDYRLSEVRELEMFRKDLYLVGKAIIPQSNPEMNSLLDSFVNFHMLYYEVLAEKRKDLEPMGDLRLFSDALSLYIQRLYFYSENPLDRLRNTFHLVYQPSIIQHHLSFSNLFKVFLAKGHPISTKTINTSSWDILGFNEFSNTFLSEIREDKDLLSTYLRNPAVYPTFTNFLSSKILVKYQQLLPRVLPDLQKELLIEKIQALLVPKGQLEYLKSLFIRLDRLLEKGVLRYKDSDLKVSRRLFEFRTKTLAEGKLILNKGDLEHDRLMGGLMMLNNPGLIVRLVEYLELKLEGGEEGEGMGQTIWRRLGLFRDMAFSREGLEVHMKIGALMGFEGGREDGEEEGGMEMKGKLDYLLQNGSLELDYLVRMLRIVYFEGRKEDWKLLMDEIDGLYNKYTAIASNFTIKIVDEYDYNRVLKEIPLLSSPESIRYWAMASPKYENLRLYIKNLVFTKHHTQHHNYPHFLQIFQLRPNPIPYQVVLSMFTRLNKPFFDLIDLKRLVWRMTVQDMRVLQAFQLEFKEINRLPKGESSLSGEEILGWFVHSLLPGHLKEGGTKLEPGDLKDLIETVEEEEPAKPVLVMLLREIEELLNKPKRTGRTKRTKRTQSLSKEGLAGLGWILLKCLGFYGMNRTEKWLMAQGFELEFGRRRLEEKKGWLFAKWKVFEEFGRLVDFSSRENKEQIEEVKRIEEEVREIGEGTVYRTGGQFGFLYEEFCRFNGEFIAEIKEMMGREGREGLGRDGKKRFGLLVENWVREGGRRFFFAFQDVLMPIYVAFEMILKGMEGGEVGGEGGRKEEEVEQGKEEGGEEEEEEGGEDGGKEECVFFKEKALDELEGIKVK